MALAQYCFFSGAASRLFSVCPHPSTWASLLVKPLSPACGLILKNEEVLDFSALSSTTLVSRDCLLPSNLGKEFLNSWKQFCCRKAGFPIVYQDLLIMHLQSNNNFSRSYAALKLRSKWRSQDVNPGRGQMCRNLSMEVIPQFAPSG